MNDTSSLAVPVVLQIDPRINPASATSRQYVATVGSKNMNYAKYEAVTHNQNNTKFYVNLVDFSITSRRVFIKYRFRVDFVGVRNGLDTNCGPRCLPLASVIENIKLKLSQADYTLTLRRNIHALMHYGSSPEERNRWLCGTPSFFDQFQTYDQLLPGGVPGNIGARNPFALYTTNPVEQTRHAQYWGQYYDVNDNPIAPDANGKSYWISDDLFEPLFIEPMNWSEQDVVGINNGDIFDLTFTYSNLSRMWSDFKADGDADRLDEVTWVGNPQLYLLHVMPQDVHPFPPIQYLPYYQLNEWPKLSGVGLAQNAETDIWSDVLTFSGIPQRYYIFAREQIRDGPLNASIARQTDTFAQIMNISIQWGTRPAVLSDADTWDLYNMSVRNGNDQSWLQWSKYQGSILCLVPGIDLPLESDEAPGVAKKINAQFKIRIKNLSAVQTQFTLFIVPIEEGYSINSNRRITHIENPLAPANVLTAQLSPVSANMIKNFYGGSVFSDIFDGIKKGLNFTSKILSPILPMLSGVPMIGPALASMGPGIAQGVINATGGRSRRRIKGSGIMSRSELKDRAEE